MKVLVPTTGGMYDWKPVQDMFRGKGWDIYGAGRIKFGLGRPDLICFTGGADVSPELYGEENTYSFCDPERDEEERIIYDMALTHGIPMVGICRGGQFLNVMNGGKMIQHIGKTISGDVVISGPKYTGPVRVDHHQGMIRSDENFAKGQYRLIDLREDESIRNENSPEYVLFYTKTRSLCFQPHPEWGHEPTKELFFDLIKEYVI